MKDNTEVDEFISSMGSSKSKIPITYQSSEVETIVEKIGGQVLNRKQRYDNGIDVVLQCSGCGEYIVQGKETNDQVDESKIYCFRCREYKVRKNILIWSKNNLWMKPEMPTMRVEYEKLINEFIKNNKPKIIKI